MTAAMKTLSEAFVSGRSLWALCGGGLACILLDSLWPRRLGSLTFGVAILALIASFALGFDQWMYREVNGTGGWLVMDRFTLFLMVTVVFSAAITLISALGASKLSSAITAEFPALVLFSAFGMALFFSSDHLLLNFIGLETLSLSSYVLVGATRGDPRAGEAAVKYFILGGIAGVMFLYGIALFYGAFGTWRLSELAIRVAAPGLAYLPRLGLAFILCGLFFKIAVVPFHFWAPDVYQGAPSPVAGFMATAVKASAFGFAVRVFLQLNVLEMPRVPELIAWIVAVTFVVASLSAIAQDDLKRMLAYSSIGHAGFLLLGLLAGFRDGLFEPLRADAVIFYLLCYLFMTLGAFAVLSLMTRNRGEATSFGDVRGLGRRHPAVAGAFALFMLSLMGLPGTAGFSAKYAVISLAVENGHIGMAVAAVVVSVVSAFYYLRPVAVMFFSEPGPDDVIAEVPPALGFTITLCAFAVVCLGLAPGTYLELAKIAVSLWG